MPEEPWNQCLCETYWDNQQHASNG